MLELDDMALLREYVERDSGEAFAALVTRHVNKVYSVALRLTGNTHHAEEITQAVFVILAKKSRHLGKRVILSGWLYQTARLTAVTLIRSEIRRARREQEAHMQTALNESDAWIQITPLLDAAMAGLSETDRHAVVLRFFDGKSMREVGVALGANEDAAKKRVNRAVEKLRHFFIKKGIALSTGVLTTAIAANSVQAAPAALATSTTAAAITKGAIASGSTLTLIKGTLKIMAWSKMKVAVITGIGLLMIAGAVTPHIKYYHYGPEAWRHRFDAEYRLKNGQNIKFIPKSALIPERLEFYRRDERWHLVSQYNAKPPDIFTLRQNEQGEFDSGGSFGGGRISLRSVMGLVFGIHTYGFEGPDSLLTLDVTGDWTTRSAASTESLLAEAEPILYKTTRHKIRFEKRSVERDVIVIQGHFKPEATNSMIQIYSDDRNGKQAGPGSGTMTRMFQSIGDRLDMAFVDETAGNSPTGNINWNTYLNSYASHMKDRREELTQKLLDNISAQTGLSFTHEMRPVEVWFITEKP